MKILLVFTMAVACSAARAQQTADVKAWGQETIRSYQSCSFVGTASKVMNRVGPEDIQAARACSEGKLEQAKATFDALPPQKASASAALKDYYAAWVAAMRSVPSRLADSSPASDRAHTSTKQRLDELWARFEIEAGL